jgi:4-hydroxy-tetrahydrodipicolinate synthase
MAALCAAHRDRDNEKAAALHFGMMPLARAMFIETNPIPVKTSLALMGRIALELRLPLVEMQPETHARLEATLKASGLI